MEIVRYTPNEAIRRVAHRKDPLRELILHGKVYPIVKTENRPN